MSALALTYLVMRHYPSFETILHFTSRDRNLMGIQTDLLGAHAMGLRNDPRADRRPAERGRLPERRPRSTTSTRSGSSACIKKLNEGTDLAGNPIGERTNFAIACARQPDRRRPRRSRSSASSEKLEAGADFVMTQPFYDMAVWERFLARVRADPEMPVLLGILPLQSFRHAEFMHNEVPGITVPQELRDRLSDAGADAQAEGVQARARAVPGGAEGLRGRLPDAELRALRERARSDRRGRGHDARRRRRDERTRSRREHSGCRELSVPRASDDPAC